MPDHQPHAVERYCDVCVIGGSAAGLAAALQLGRQRRSAIVVDAGDPRNAPAEHLHSFLGHEALAPAELLATGREEVRSYGGEVLDGTALAVTRADGGGFRVELAGGNAIVARRVLAATGIADELPEIDGLAEHWGRDVIHCAFCHGFEARDRRVVILATHPMTLHSAALFRQLTDRLTLLVHEPAGIDELQLQALTAAGVDVRRGSVNRVLSGDDGRLAGVELGDRRIDADVVVVGPRFRARVEAFASLGLRPTPHASGLGDVLEADALGATMVAGVYAAGNVTDPSQQVLEAAADGSRIGAMISFSLADEDLRAATRKSANETDWDHRYAGRQMWSGNPNGTLVNEVTRLTPGTALDVGAGEGADAIWLAERGWQVTANDISERALETLAAEATSRGLVIHRLRSDANALDPFEVEAFSLVTAQYASIPRTPDSRGLNNLLRAVARGGTLLITSHDLEPMRGPIDTRTQSRAFDPDAYLRVEDFADALGRASEWTIELYERRPRPDGAATTHHVDDVVLRARRH